jgi:amidase
MCNSTRDVEYFLRSVLSAKPHLRDPYLIPVNWDPPVLTGKKIKVGIMTNNQHVTPHPPILRALEYAKEKLSKHPDIELVEYKPYNHVEGYGIAAELYFPEGRKIVDKLTKEAGEDIHPLTEYVLSVGKEHDAVEVFDLLGRREDFRHRHLLDWVEQGCEYAFKP